MKTPHSFEAGCLSEVIARLVELIIVLAAAAAVSAWLAR